MSILKYNIFLKIGIIFFLSLILLIPALMIQGLVREREQRQQDAIWEVSSKWGEEQTITGPFLTIPYYKYVRSDRNVNFTKVLDYLYFLPDELNIEGEVNPEKKKRGIYEIVVYNSAIDISGAFKDLDLSRFDIPMEDIMLDRATISVGISDLAGLEEQVDYTWNDEEGLFNPGAISTNLISSGIHTAVKICPDSCSYNFEFDLKFKGSQKLYFVPLGMVTDVNLVSSWDNPSFNGTFLPDDSEVDEDGFIAKWNVLHLNRNYPQSWVGNQYTVSESAFGVDLILPVDKYQKIMRAIKYAILFIAFTFLVFFFVEVLARRFIHPIQYILVGIALIVFFSLLLAISEHLNFDKAYIISAVSVLLLICAYVRAILKSKMLTFLIGGILTILYAFIFFILQLQDYALLTGSIFIFVILALVMYFSRKINWYNIRIDQSKQEDSD